MQDHYTGDIGDFVKYGLLRAIRGRKHLGVAWYLNPEDEPERNGQHTATPTAPAPDGLPRTRSDKFEADPVIEAYKRDVDRTLLRQNLRRSVTERVENLIALQRLAEEARRAGQVRGRDS